MSADADGPLLLPEGFRDETTRLLCATAHLEPLFAASVLIQIADLRIFAVAPPHGVDLVAVYRHSMQSRSRRMRRDGALCLVLLIALFGLAAIGGLGVSAWGPGVALGSSLLVVVVALALSWAVRFVELREARMAALDLVERGDAPRQQAPAADRNIEQRLAKLNHTNVVVYDAALDHPFVGSGWLAGKWNLPPISVSRPMRDEQGRVREVQPFDTANLHRSLVGAMRGGGFEGLQVGSRLYVRGDVASRVPGLIPEPGQPPEPMVDPSLVEGALFRHSRSLRTYASLEHITSGGQVAVAMFVFIQLQHGLLSVEAQSLFMPPLAAGYGAVQNLHKKPAALTLRTLRDAARRPIRVLVRSPGRLIGFQQRKRNLHRLEQRVMRRARQVGWHDYGAGFGLREIAADIHQARLVDYADEERYLRQLQHQVLEHVERFLQNRGVDTSDLREQKNHVINNTSFDFHGDIQGKNFIIGTDGTVHAGGGDGSNPRG